MAHHRRVVLTAVVTLVTMTVAWLLILRPLASGAVEATPATAVSPTASPTTRPAFTRAAVSPRAAAEPSTRSTASAPRANSPSGRCVVGTPARLEIPALNVDAAFENIGLDTSAPADAQGRRGLGNPKDRTQAGWYSAGPRPGAGVGTVLVNGHTYHDGSAIFKESFAARIATGQRIDVKQSNGSVCSYQVQRVWRDVDAKSEYPTIVANQGLYDFGGPERLFLATCGGPFDPSIQNYNQISLLIATPIDRG